MEVLQSVGQKAALWVLVCSSVYASAWAAPPAPTPTPKPISGRAGIVLSHGVVNFSQMAKHEALNLVKPVQKVEPPERDAPPKVLPADAIIKLEPPTATSKSNATGAAGPPRQLTAVLAKGFQAENDLDSNVIPPDTQGTVGPNHLIVTLNSNIIVQDRSGNRLSFVTLDNFWAPTGNSRTTDPRVVYDPYNDRWIISTSGDFLLSTSGVLIGVSQTGDPTGNWNLYKVAVDSTNQHFCDFPTLGFNKTWVVVMCNVFANASNSNFFAGTIYAFDKSSLYNGSGAVHTVFDTGGDSNVTPAITYDNNLDAEYLVEEYNGNQNGMGTMRLWAINGPAGSPTLSTIAFPATTQTWAENGPNNFGPQLGTSTGIDTGDARIGNVIYRNGTLWTTHPVFLPNSTPNRCSIQWWQIDTGGNVLQRGLIDSPDGSYFRSYPSIAVNQHNDALIGYGRFSPNEHPGGFYSFRASTDPAGTLETESPVKTGDAVYVRTGGSSNLNRWGDYSNTSVDPTDDISFWTIQEYAFLIPSNWSTWWGQVIVIGLPVNFQVSLTPATTTLTAGVPLTDLAVTAVDAQGHTVPDYAGTVHFTSTDPSLSIPDYTFTTSDNGTHHFARITFFKAGSQSITMTDAANSIQATLNFIVLPGPLASFSVPGPGSAAAGISFPLTVTAQDAFQNIITNYNQTVQFFSSDATATLPVSYTFVPGTDNGTHSFNATLHRAGLQNVAVFAGGVTAGLNVNISPAAATHFVVSAPTNATRTVAFKISVTAQDQFNNLATGYRGTVHFISSDGAAALPADYTFSAGDQGTHYFSGVTLNTLGGQTVTATDTVTNTINGVASINVAHLSGAARILRVRLGKTFNLPLADFTDESNPLVSGLTATIDWGDGNTNPGTITAGYTVSGSHSYRSLPEHPITITVTDTANGYGPVAITGPIRIWPKTESH